MGAPSGPRASLPGHSPLSWHREGPSAAYPHQWAMRRAVTRRRAYRSRCGNMRFAKFLAGPLSPSRCTGKGQAQRILSAGIPARPLSPLVAPGRAKRSVSGPRASLPAPLPSRGTGKGQAQRIWSASVPARPLSPLVAPGRANRSVYTSMGDGEGCDAPSVLPVEMREHAVREIPCRHAKDAQESLGIRMVE